MGFRSKTKAHMSLNTEAGSFLRVATQPYKDVNHGEVGDSGQSNCNLQLSASCIESLSDLQFLESYGGTVLEVT